MIIGQNGSGCNGGKPLSLFSSLPVPLPMPLVPKQSLGTRGEGRRTTDEFAAHPGPKNPIHSINSAFASLRRLIMALRSRPGRRALGILGILGLAGSLAGQTDVPGPGAAASPPVAVGVPSPAPCDRPLPINLPTALQLAGARPL